MDADTNWCFSPARVRASRAHLQPMFARWQIGQRDIVLCAQVDPLIAEVRNPIGQPVVSWRGEIERCEFERDDACCGCNLDVVQQPKRFSAVEWCSEHVDSCQDDGGWRAGLVDCLGVEEVKST